MDKQAANTVIERSNDLLSFTILRRSIWTRKSDSNAMLSEISSESMIVKFLTIVSLERNQRELELGTDIGMEGQQASIHIRFAS